MLLGCQSFHKPFGMCGLEDGDQTHYICRGKFPETHNYQRPNARGWPVSSRLIPPNSTALIRLIRLQLKSWLLSSEPYCPRPAPRPFVANDFSVRWCYGRRLARNIVPRRCWADPTRSALWPAAEKFVAFSSQIAPSVPVFPTHPVRKCCAVYNLRFELFHGLEASISCKPYCSLIVPTTPAL
jgi:hypothetical protein